MCAWWSQAVSRPCSSGRSSAVSSEVSKSCRWADSTTTACRRSCERAGFEDGPAATEIARVSRGHPLALRLALEARLAGGEMPEADSMSQVVDALAGAFRAGLDEDARLALDAAAVPRRITRGVLAAMLGDESADDALDTLSRLAFVEATSEGLRLHDAVQSAIVERLRALDPERFRRYRAAAWHYLQTETRGVARHELARSTADLLFLIDNPVVREAMFPTTTHAYSVEPARIEDTNELRSLWHRYDPPEAAHALDLWLERVRKRYERSVTGPERWWVARSSPSGATSRSRSNATTRSWARGPDTPHCIRCRTGSEPSSTVAPSPATPVRGRAAPRPPRGSTSSGTTSRCVPSSVGSTSGSPIPLRSRTRSRCWDSSSWNPSRSAMTVTHPAALDFGPESVDGWLSRLAAAELGIADRGFLDPEDRTVDLGEQRVQLSPLEFGVLATLSERPGRAVTRAELINRVWGTTYVGGSNVVDVVVRSLRRKLGPAANRVETARGVGYRLN